MSSSTQRNLTLTEELEKLEQSITLTLQEIDSNFSRAHRIVTTSILPIVEQYAEHSKDVWEGAKFWKQFFEASANVSLSGYEENPNGEDTTEHDDQTVTEEESTNMTQTSLDEAASSFETPSSEHLDLGHHESELDLSSLTISPSHSTPRPPQAHQKGKLANLDDDETPSSPPSYPSGYGEEESNVAGHDGYTASMVNDDDGAPVTPGRQQQGRYQQHLSAETPMSSPFIPPPTISRNNQPSALKKQKQTQKNHQKPTDPVLHHVLDKTYRVQATPLSKSYKPTKFSVITPNKDNKDSNNKAGYNFAYDDSPQSSPELEAPKLHKELFSFRGGSTTQRTPGTNRKAHPYRSPQKRTPKPGISVLTPGKPKSSNKNNGWESDEEGFAEDDDDTTTNALGFSPPKTMQFHIPQSRLMKTPAKEASKRIVSDLLATAGTMDDDDEYLNNRYRAEDDERSPAVIRSGGRLEDETF